MEKNNRVLIGTNKKTGEVKTLSFPVSLIKIIHYLRTELTLSIINPSKKGLYAEYTKLKVLFV